MANSRPPRPAPDDAFPTSTSRLQAETEAVLLDHIPTSETAAKLNKSAHIQFLARNFIQGFPAKYTSQDASQPWLMFWTLQSFSVLQVGLDPGNKQRCVLSVVLDIANAHSRAIDTVLTWQHPDGGFGGGPGQAAHLLATYASVCALSIAGRPGENGGWDQIDRYVVYDQRLEKLNQFASQTRKKMYRFFMSLKQPDGSFLVAHHAEVDVRCVQLRSHFHAHRIDLHTRTAGFTASSSQQRSSISSHPS